MRVPGSGSAGQRVRVPVRRHLARHGPLRRTGQDGAVSEQPAGADLLLGRLAAGRRSERLLHVHRVPARSGRHRSLAAVGRARPAGGVGGDRGRRSRGRTRSQAAELAHAGRHVVVATGTASGKSLAYQLPALSASLEGRGAERRGATVLYLVAHQGARARPAARASHGSRCRACAPRRYDGDTPTDERGWAREHADSCSPTPTCCTARCCPGTRAGPRSCARLRYVVVDECHVYRGVFGSHVAQRAAPAAPGRARATAPTPTFVLASATVADPAATARAADRAATVAAVTDDGSPRGARTFALWEPPLDELRGEHGAPVRRSAIAETADLLDRPGRRAGRGRSRSSGRGAARRRSRSTARDLLAEVDPSLASRVAAYRGGYLPEERRALEQALRSGALLGRGDDQRARARASTSPGLDAVLLAGWPGTPRVAVAAGRARRAARARARWPCSSPATTRSTPISCTTRRRCSGSRSRRRVLDPANPYVLGPHLCAAAAELPLTRRTTCALFGAAAARSLDALVDGGLLRRRAGAAGSGPAASAPATSPTSAARRRPVRVVEAGTGRLLGTVDAGAAHSHRPRRRGVPAPGRDVRRRRRSTSTTASRCVTPSDADYTTLGPRGHRHRRRRRATACVPGGRSRLCSAPSRSRARSSPTCAALPHRRGARRGAARPARAHAAHHGGVVDAAAPTRWRRRSSRTPTCPAPLHAAEHASIGLLPLVATCDRWDIGGVSTALHPDTGAADRRSCTTATPAAPGSPSAASTRRATWLRRHPRRDRGLRVPRRLPVVRAVPEVRQRQRAARQAGRGAPAHGCPGRRRPRPPVALRATRDR